MGLLYRRFSTEVDSHTLLEMYKLLVIRVCSCSSLESHKDITNLENVQKFALRMCHKTGMLVTRNYWIYLHCPHLRIGDYT